MYIMYLFDAGIQSQRDGISKVSRIYKNQKMILF